MTIQAIAGFALGYAAILAIPGPNMLAIGGIAALRGPRAALPFCLGMAAGAGLLAMALQRALSLADAVPGLVLSSRCVGAFLLSLMALWILRQRTPTGEPGDEPATEGPAFAAFGAGLCIAATNPITGAFFVSQFLGAIAQLPAQAQGFVLLLVPLEALGIALVAALLLGCAGARRIAMAWQRPIRFAVAGAFLALAARALYAAMTA